jgi:hypothetical protein
MMKLQRNRHLSKAKKVHQNLQKLVDKEIRKTVIFIGNRVWVNQQLVFPLSATDFPLSAFHPNVSFCMLPAGGEQRKAESPLTLAEIGAVDLP